MFNTYQLFGRLVLSRAVLLVTHVANLAMDLILRNFVQPSSLLPPICLHVSGSSSGQLSRRSQLAHANVMYYAIM